jgi:phospholipid/cholesterol/gamma-HCH transport system substrate-binding protein
VAQQRSIEVRVGIFVLVCLVVVAGLIIKFGKYERLSAKTYTITVIFPNVGGLVRDANVSYAGIGVGKVRSIRLTEEGQLRAKVELAIYEGVVIRSDAKFVVNQSGLLGDRYVDVLPQSTTAPPLKPGDEIEGASSVDLTEAIRGVVEVLHQAAGTIAKIDDVARHTDDAIKRTDEAIKRIDEIILSTQTLNHVSSALANVDTTTSNAVVFSMALRSVVDDNRQTVSNTLAKLALASDNLTSASKKIDDLVVNNQGAINAATKDVAQSAQRLNDLLEKLQRGEGTAGKLIVDPTLHDEILRLVQNWRRYGLLYKDTSVRPTKDKLPEDKSAGPSKPRTQNFRPMPSDPIPAN